MGYVIKDMDETDIERMAGAAREADLIEFDLMSGGKPFLANLQHLHKRSRMAKAAYVNGDLVCVYGVISPAVLSTVANPWLAATDKINDPGVRRLFLRHSRRELAGMAVGVSKFWNVVWEDNEIAIRWLKWLGFVFTGEAYDIRGKKFLYFKMEADDVRG